MVRIVGMLFGASAVRLFSMAFAVWIGYTVLTGAADYLDEVSSTISASTGTQSDWGTN